MASEAQIQQLMTLINTCTEVPVDSLISNPDWGSINFEEARPDLEKFVSMLTHLKMLPVEQLPDAAISAIVQHGQPVSGVITNIKKFSIMAAPVFLDTKMR